MHWQKITCSCAIPHTLSNTFHGCADRRKGYWENPHGTVVIQRYLSLSVGWGDSLTPTGPRFNIKMSSYQYRKFHCGNKTVVRSSYLHNGISYAGKMSSLYWIRALVASHYLSLCVYFVSKVTHWNSKLLRNDNKWNIYGWLSRHHFVYAPSQWETMLQCDVVFHWLGT